MTDEKYFAITLANAARLSRSRNRNFDIFIFYEGESAIDIPCIAGIQIFERRLSRYFDFDMPESDKWPKIVYYRIIAPFILQDLYDKVAYFDADMAFWGPIDDLLEMDLGGATMAAVRDIATIAPAIQGLEISTKEWLKRLGLNSDRYFNSGFLLIDVKKWCATDYEEELTQYIRSNRSNMMMWDQDFLNYIHQDNWKELSPRWNFQIPLFGYGFEKAFNPVIFHYTGGAKPWEPKTFRFQSIHSEYFKRALENIGRSDAFCASASSAFYLRKARNFLRTLIYHSPLGARKFRRRAKKWSDTYHLYREHFRGAIETPVYWDVVTGISPHIDLGDPIADYELEFKDGKMKLRESSSLHHTIIHDFEDM